MSLPKELKDYLQEKPLTSIWENFRESYKVNFKDIGNSVFGNPIGEAISRIPIILLWTQLCRYISKGNFFSPEIENLLSRMSRIEQWMDSTAFDFAPFEPLARLILNHAADLEIWKCLMQLVDTLETIINRPTDQANKLAAPSIYRHVGAQLDRGGKTMEELKESMRHELSGSVFMNVRGFWKKYFQAPKWSKYCTALSKVYVARSGEESLKFPKDPAEADVWKWMKAVETEIINSPTTSQKISSRVKRELAKSRSMHTVEATQCHTLAKGQIEGGQTDRQLDYFIKRNNISGEVGHHWRDVLVVGELTKLPTSAFLDKFLQLCVYMSEVFLAQPLRQFVHGFILFGTQLQLWVFDRSGPYCESFIDVGESQKKLVHVLAAYMLMSDKQHGIDANIRYDGDRIFIKMKVPGSNEMQELALSSKPLVCQSALVSRGTTVYLAWDKTFVVKFSWKNCGDTSEADLLLLAKDVIGMAKLVGWRDLAQTSRLRKGLTFTHLMVKCTRPAEEVLTTPVVLSGKSVQYLKKSTSKTESRKRKNESQQAGDKTEPVSKRTRMGTKEASRSVPVVEIRARPKDTAARERKDTSAEERIEVAQDSPRRSSRIKELRMSQSIGVKRKIPEDVQLHDCLKRVHLSINTDEPASNQTEEPESSLGDESNHSSATETSEESTLSFTSDLVPSGYKIERAECVDIRKRKQAAVAISPVGKPLTDFNNSLEVVIGLRDAIKAHRSLYLDAKILHRDISVNNVLLKISDDPEDYGGILIDLDLATLFKDGKAQGKLQAMTGTMQFMALEILKNSFGEPGAVVSHSYRHDLESFFYVLLWICIRYGWPDDKSPHMGFLKKWYSGTADEIHSNKEIYMSERIFKERVFKMISPGFKDVDLLVWQFWKVLFCDGQSFQTGLAQEDETMYGLILEAFEYTILDLKSIATR